MSRPRYSLGIDLGTTFVAAALANGTTVEMFILDDHSVVIPAVVYLQGDGTLATGEAASRHAVSSPDRIGRGFMSRLGDAMPVMLGGAPYALTAVLGGLLRDVVQKVIESEGEPPDCVVLTHPPSWGPFRCVLFEEVARQAGLKNPAMVTEAEATVAHYAASRQLVDGETVTVYDLGGGTFDATVLRQQPGDVQILGKPERMEGLGGVGFDEVILSYVNDAAEALTKLDMRHRQSIVTLARLRQDYCTLAKEALSADAETIFPVFVPGGRFDVHFTRSDFEDMVRAPIGSTIRTLSRVLQSAQVQPADLSAVLLVGGSSRIPLVAGWCQLSWDVPLSWTHIRNMSSRLVPPRWPPMRPILNTTDPPPWAAARQATVRKTTPQSWHHDSNSNGHGEYGPQCPAPATRCAAAHASAALG